MRALSYLRELLTWGTGTSTLFISLLTGLLGFMLAKAHYADHVPGQWLFEQMAITAVFVSCVLWFKGVLERTKPS